MNKTSTHDLPHQDLQQGYRMSFGLVKCDSMMAKREKVIRTAGVMLPEGRIENRTEDRTAKHTWVSHRLVGTTMRMEGGQPPSNTSRGTGAEKPGQY